MTATNPALLAAPSQTQLVVPLRVRRCAARSGLLVPLTIGVPLPAGAWREGDAEIRLGDDAVVAPCQTKVLARWADGSVKWLLVRGLFRPGLVENGQLVLWTARASASLTSQTKPELSHSGEIIVSTQAARFRLSTGEAFLSAAAAAKNDSREVCCRLVCIDRKGRPSPVTTEHLHVEEAGPLVTLVAIEGALSKLGLRFSGNVCFYSGSAQVRVEVTLENPRRARHAGGYWDLGDPGSVLLKGWLLELEIPSAAGKSITWFEQPTAPLQTTLGDQLDIYQHSSGGENWHSSNHVNRHGEVPLRFRGYKVSVEEGESGGHRSSPVVCLANDEGHLACALEEFWQKFPSALEVSGCQLRAHFWPPQMRELYELQAGEHCTRVVWLDFENDSEGACQRLAWIHDPPQAVVDPDWIAGSQAVSYVSAPDPFDARRCDRRLV
jgi:hypothetical protein